MTITIIGHGYVGLVTACVFADFGNRVYVIGRTKEKLAKLNSGDPLIYEPGLQELLKKNLAAKRISFGSDYEKPIEDSEIVFIAVGTPSGENGEADLSQVFEVAEKIAKNLSSKQTLVACKSTVPVGTNLKIKEVINKHKPKTAEFEVVSCPEFLREGTGISDTIHPDRVIIGVENKKAAKKMLELHGPVGGEKIITDLASAELIKYASNSLLATKISFANMISFYCQAAGADVNQVLKAVGLDNRIGTKFLDPGIGYGGACFPKDVKALIYTGQQLGVDASILEATEKTNNLAQENFTKTILNNHPGKKLAIWGLSFKPNTDDIRQAPSLKIIDKLLSENYELTAYDPQASKHVKKIFPQIKYADNPLTAVKGAEGLIIMTEWNEFKQIDLKQVKTLMQKPVIFDGRNIYDLETMKTLGFRYFSVGRKPVNL